jgi:hypothetical protein
MQVLLDPGPVDVNKKDTSQGYGYLHAFNMLSIEGIEIDRNGVALLSHI